MCTGLEPAAYGAIAAALAGAGTQAYEQNRTVRKQDNAAAQAIINQGAKNAKGNQAVQENIKKLQQSNPEGDVASRVAAYTDAVKRATPQAQAGLGDVRGASRKFAEDVGAARQDVTATALDQGATQARVDAPALQRLRETQSANDTATKLNMISADAAGQAFIDKLKMQAIQNNPWIMAAGEALKGYGTASAGGALTGGSGTSAGKAATIYRQNPGAYTGVFA